MRGMKQYPVIAALSMTLASCSGGKVRQYAAELAALLESYSVQVEAKLDDEQSRYLTEAERIERRIEEWAEEGLEAERAAAATRIATQLAAGRVGPLNLMDTLLPQYAAKDFQQTKTLYEKDMDAHLEHIQNLDDLSLEKAKITTLREILQDLARKPNFTELAKDLASFGQELREQVNYLKCVDAHTAVGRLEQEANNLREQINEPGISSEQKTGLEASLKLVEAEQAAVSATRTSTNLFDGQQCQQPGSNSSAGSSS